MSTVRYYRWDDAGAPTLTGEVGSLTNLLRKCLVGTAGTAYGSKAAAGWSEEFAGAAANIAVFRNSGSAGGCECCVRINDNAPGSAGAKEAQVLVYAAMTDVDTGTLGTAATWFRKSATANTTARKWLVVADERTAWVYSFDTGDPNASYFWDASLHGFGDIDSIDAPENGNRYFVLGRVTQNDEGGGAMSCFTGFQSFGNSLQVAKSDGLAAPEQCTFIMRPETSFGGSNPAMPVTISGDLVFVGPPVFFPASKVLRGALRGLSLAMTRVEGLADGGLVPGSTSAVLVCGMTSSSAGLYNAFGASIDTVGPW